VRDGGKTYLNRFSKSERAVHWIHAAAFFVLLGSGLVLYLPSLAGIGNRGLVKDVHLYTAIAWALALLAVVLLGDRKGLRRTLNDLDGSIWTIASGYAAIRPSRAASTRARSSTPR